jgi:hypothetical protein
MLEILKSRLYRTLIGVFGECVVTGLWAYVDAQFVVKHASWFVGVGLGGLVALWFLKEIKEFVDFKRGAIESRESPILVSEHLVCESTGVVDETGREWPELEAVTIYLQVFNGKGDGTTIRGLRASLNTPIEKLSLPIRNNASDVRHGDVEMVQLGTVIATPAPGTRLGLPISDEPYVLAKTMCEYIVRGGGQRALQVAGGHKHKIGSGVPFRVVVTGEDTVARSVRYESDFTTLNAYEWLRQVEGN